MFRRDKERPYIIESIGGDVSAIMPFLLENNISYHITGFLEKDHRLVHLTGNQLKEIRPLLKKNGLTIRKGM